MSRIARIDVRDWDPELRAALRADDMPAVQRGLFETLAHRPKTAEAVAALYAAIAQEQTLSSRLFELMRLRMAFHNQCRTCMAIRYQDGVDDGVTEDLVCSLEKPMEAPDLTEAERAVLAYTDRFMTNHLAIEDADIDRLREHFDEGQIVEIHSRLGASSFGRLAAVLNMVEDLPAHFSETAGQRVTPWGSPHVVVGARMAAAAA